MATSKIPVDMLFTYPHPLPETYTRTRARNPTRAKNRTHTRYPRIKYTRGYTRLPACTKGLFGLAPNSPSLTLGVPHFLRHLFVSQPNVSRATIVRQVFYTKSCLTLGGENERLTLGEVLNLG